MYQKMSFRAPPPDNPPRLTLKKRPRTLSVAAILRDVGSEAGGNLGPSEARRKAAHGLLLLWHDHWPEAHAIAQAHEGESDFDLLHALGHRREGDYANAIYWLNEAGNHPVYWRSGSRLGPMFAEDALLCRKLLPGDHWNPRGFVKAVEESPDHPLLRRVQAEEFLAFFEYLLGP